MVPLFILQETRPIDQYVTFVFSFFAIMLNLETPLARRLVPGRLDYFRLKLDVFG